MDKNDILDYVMNTPGNTNRAVLNSMLNSVSGGSGSNVFMINDTLEGSAHTLDKTYEEIETAFLSGKPCIIHTTKSWSGGTPRDINVYDIVLGTARDDDIDLFSIYTSNSYSTSAVNQYPIWDEDPNWDEG